MNGYENEEEWDGPRFANALRAIAEFYTVNREAPLPAASTGTAMEFCGSLEVLVERSRELGGTWIPDDPIRGDYFKLRHAAFAGTPFCFELFCSASQVGEARRVAVPTVRTVDEFTPAAGAAELLARIELAEAQAA